MTEVRYMQKVKVRGQRSRSQRSKPQIAVSGPLLNFESTYDDEMMHKAWSSIEEVPCCFSRSSIKFKGHTGNKSPILTRIQRFGIVTPLLIHPWLWNDAQSLISYRRGPLMFMKVIHQVSRSHGIKIKSPILTRIQRFRTVTQVWIHPWLWNDAESLILYIRGALLFFKVIHQVSCSHGTKVTHFDPNLAFPDCNSSLNSPMALKWCTKLDVV